MYMSHPVTDEIVPCPISIPCPIQPPCQRETLPKMQQEKGHLGTHGKESLRIKKDKDFSFVKCCLSRVEHHGSLLLGHCEVRGGKGPGITGPCPWGHQDPVSALFQAELSDLLRT